MTTTDLQGLPPTVLPPSLARTARDTSALVWRCLRRSTRQLDTVFVSALLPVMLLLLFVYVFGGAIDASGDYVDFVVPGIVLLTAGYAAANTAVEVATDKTSGLMDRFRSMPIRATGVVTGHVVASMVRNALSTALVIGVAFLVGFSPHASVLAWCAAIGLLGLFVLALTWVGVAVGLVASGPEAASGFTFVILFLPYLSSAFVPVDTMPSVLASIASVNPVTPMADAVRGLLLGVPVGSAGWQAVAWMVGVFVVARVAAGVLFRRAD